MLDLAKHSDPAQEDKWMSDCSSYVKTDFVSNIKDCMAMYYPLVARASIACFLD